MNGTSRTLATLAAERYGVINTGLARRHGISPRTLSHEVGRGRLTRLHRSVYLVGVGPFSDHTRWRAALDACGERAALTLWSAARAWNISTTLERTTDVIAPVARRNRSGIRVHHSRRWCEADVTVVDGMRVLRVERLLVELADVCSVGRLCRLLDQAQFRGILDLDLLIEMLPDHRNRRGHHRLRRAISMLLDGSTGTRSRFEEGVIDRVIEVRGVPRHVCSRVDIAGLSVEPDIHYPTLALMVEVDDPTHDQPVKRRSDRSNDRRLLAAGTTVARIHWSDVDGGVTRANAEIARRCLAQGVHVDDVIVRRWIAG